MRIKLVRVWLFSIIITSSITKADIPESITVVSPSYWCPFSCPAGSKNEGFAIEIARASLAVSNITLIYHNLNYDRALMEARSGTFNAVIPTLKDEAPDFIFPVEPVSATEFCFYTSQQSDWAFTEITSLNQIRFAATSGYNYNSEVDAYIVDYERVSVLLLKGDNIPERMVKMLKANRIHAFLDDTRLVDYLKQHTRPKLHLRKAGCLKPIQYGFLALSPMHEYSSEVALLFDAGLRIIRKSGQFENILKRYGVADWHQE